MSGECPKCGEHTLECLCKEYQQRDTRRALLQEFINLNSFSAYETVIMLYDYILFIFLTNFDEGAWSQEEAIKYLKKIQDSGLAVLEKDILEGSDTLLPKGLEPSTP